MIPTYVPFAALCQVFQIQVTSPRADELRELLSNRHVVGLEPDVTLVARGADMFVPLLALERVAGAAPHTSPIIPYIAHYYSYFATLAAPLPAAPPPQGLPAGGWGDAALPASPAPAAAAAPAPAPAPAPVAPVPPPVPAAAPPAPPTVPAAPPSAPVVPPVAPPNMADPANRIAAALGAPANSDAAPPTLEDAQGAPIPTGPEKTDKKPSRSRKKNPPAAPAAPPAVPAVAPPAPPPAPAAPPVAPPPAVPAAPAPAEPGANVPSPSGLTLAAAHAEANKVLGSSGPMSKDHMREIALARRAQLEDQITLAQVELAMLTEIVTRYLG